MQLKISFMENTLIIFYLKKQIEHEITAVLHLYKEVGRSATIFVILQTL